MGVYNAIISKITNGIPFYQLYDAQKTLLRTFYFEIELQTTNQCILYYTIYSTFELSLERCLAPFKIKIKQYRESNKTKNSLSEKQSRCIVPKYTVKK